MTTSPFFSYGQITPKLSRVGNSEVVALLGEIIDFEEINTKTFSLSIIKSENQSGSLNTFGTDEITYKYYLAISEYDEYPERSLFVIDNLYNPTITKKTAYMDQIVIKLEIGSIRFREEKTVIINLHDVNIE